MASETPAIFGGGNQDTKGKHRILVELNRLEQETKFLQSELDDLENVDNVSIPCKELLESVQKNPDPLLPLTKGLTNPSWDRWFEAPFDSNGTRCVIV
ncbi:Guanine nucleotide-binding protein subunit gamma 1 [Zostera marina]|uniref:Guanine nucleotide-binding protein subunit gamma 1 n=1 Tax=Zostera marina TaxID=29655 RepID=A0A0K9PV88_ZOSMR|nr:Guanine nucleotide-binding protein subunit gamma 1 [Zostera marina]